MHLLTLQTEVIEAKGGLVRRLVGCWREDETAGPGSPRAGVPC